MYLIIGGSGYLGHYCIKNILELTNEKIISTYSETTPPSYKKDKVEWVRLDVCNNDELNEIAKRVDSRTKIIYLAAFHHPDKVKNNPELAWKINIIALANAVNIFAHAKCLYYSSTDSVYGEGSLDRKFVETDRTNPVNLYGKHKALAEQITITRGFNVVRFPFIFGPSLVENRPHFFDNLKSDIENGKPIEMFNDSYRSTLSFNQCSKYLIQLIEKYGACEEQIINISSDRALSKYEAALIMCEKYNLNKNMVKPISVDNCEGIFDAQRAKSAIIDNEKMKKLLNLDRVELEI